VREGFLVGTHERVSCCGSTKEETLELSPECTFLVYSSPLYLYEDGICVEDSQGIQNHLDRVDASSRRYPPRN